MAPAVGHLLGRRATGRQYCTQPVKACPLLLLDEPTGSLDGADTPTLIELICDISARGAAIMGIFHDVHVGNAVAAWRVNVAAFRNLHQSVMHVIETKKT